MRVRTARLTAGVAALALFATACGGDGEPSADGPDTDSVDVPDDGPTVTVASFNFPESTILAEIYAQALEDAGYPVERQLDLGARELIFPQLQSGELSLLPEYLGSAIATGFGEDAPDDVDAGVVALQELFGDDVVVLEPAPAVNSNAFVTTSAFADENDLTTVADLAGLGATFAGPPECEERVPCFLGLVDVYGLDDLSFSSIQEGGARLGALQGGEVELALFFSTDAILADDALRVLEDPEGIVPPENITPVLAADVADAYGDDLTGLLDAISAQLTTEVLVELNTRASEGIAPSEIAADWLAQAGIG